jgi:hypothetical protein
MGLRRPNPKGAGALRTISASRPGPDAQRHLLPVRDIELLRKPQARRYRYSRSGALNIRPGMPRDLAGDPHLVSLASRRAPQGPTGAVQ